jgi:AraC-like DNA-binding protein
MVSKFFPQLDEVYFINKHTLFHIIWGSGAIQVDFKNYFDSKDKIIYLDQGQYIKFLSDDFVVRKIEFQDNEVFRNKDVRVLFKHLISLGYIDFDECIDCQKYLSDNIFSETVSEIIDISSKQWFWQNPFSASKDEYHIIFDVKDIVDKEYHNHLSQIEITELVNANGYAAQELMKNKVGISIKNLMSDKRLLESKRNIAFTDKNIQEVAYEMGYKDPAYFNRVFTKIVGSNPVAFRNMIDFERNDTFVQDIIGLLKTYHKEEHSLSFYSDKMHMTVKTLSKKVKSKLSVSIGQLIRQELILSAQKMLVNGVKIKEVATALHFEEANHFSSFYKRYTGKNPSDLVNKKYN